MWKKWCRKERMKVEGEIGLFIRVVKDLRELAMLTMKSFIIKKCTQTILTLNESGRNFSSQSFRAGNSVSVTV